jgi:hypothetical protein
VKQFDVPKLITVTVRLENQHEETQFENAIARFQVVGDTPKD